MTIYNGTSSSFIGDCKYGNFDVNFATTDYPTAELSSNFNTDVTSLLTSKVLSLSNVATSITSNHILYRWTPLGDVEDSFLISKRFESYKGGTSASRMYDIPNTQLLNATASASANSTYFMMVSDGYSVGMVNWLLNTNKTIANYEFWYQGQMTNLNTGGSGYYSNDIVNHSVCIMARGTTSLATASVLIYTGGASRSALSSGKGSYGIACAGVTPPTPTTFWGTDWYIYDSDSAKGTPVIGKVRNIAYAVGTYTLGRPTKFGSASSIDGDYNCWLPIATFGGKTLLLRCYSSSIIGV
jgi:hypothetical protein